MFDPIPSSIEYDQERQAARAGGHRRRRVRRHCRTIPPMGEFLPGYEANGWQGIGVPKNTPAEIIDKLNKEINAALADPSDAGRGLPTSVRTVFASHASGVRQAHRRTTPRSGPRR